MVPHLCCHILHPGNTVYAKNYAYCSYIEVCCRSIPPISFRVTSPTLGQSYGCPSVSKATLVFFPYPSGLFHRHWGNHMIAPLPVKQPWWIWINTNISWDILHNLFHFLLSPWFHALKTKCRQIYNIVITGGTVSCHFDYLRCHQWWQCCQFDDLLFSVMCTAIPFIQLPYTCTESIGNSICKPSQTYKAVVQKMNAANSF